jgi:hypothetical protein
MDISNKSSSEEEGEKDEEDEEEKDSESSILEQARDCRLTEIQEQVFCHSSVFYWLWAVHEKLFPRAQYLSPSTKERKKRKRRNRRQRSIKTELELMKMRKNLEHPAHLSPKSPRKQVAVLLQ